jgi:hypothetical protein
MASLKELNLSNDQVGGDIDLNDLPKTGGFLPMLQPGTYRLRLPGNLGNVWDTIAKKGDRGERIVAKFDQDAPLVIVQAPERFADRKGEPFQTRISNVERARGREKILASDFDYLLRALGHTGKKPRTNGEYAAALMPFAGKEFNATIEVTAQCRDDKEKYVDDGHGGSVKLEGSAGCGRRYYQKDIPKNDDGSYPERIACAEDCGANLRVSNQIGSFEAAK